MSNEEIRIKSLELALSSVMQSERVPNWKVIEDAKEFYEFIIKKDFKHNNELKPDINLIFNEIIKLKQLLNRNGNYYHFCVIKSGGNEDLYIKYRNDLHSEIVNMIKDFKFEQSFDFSEKPNGSKQIYYTGK